MRMVERDIALCLLQRGAQFKFRGIGQQGAGQHRRAIRPLALDHIREDAHITVSGDLSRMPQHAVVISGTSTLSSISGNSTVMPGSCASMSKPWAA